MSCLCEVVMKKIIYADNAATTALDIDAFEAMKPYLLHEYGNASQLYSFAKPAKRALANAREVIADCIGAQPEEIFFTSGGTESDNWAIKGIMQHNYDNVVITDKIEHHAILNSCAKIKHMGCQVDYLSVDSKGIVKPSVLHKFITNKTKLVSVMLVNNEIGTIEPVEELAKISHEYKGLFHTDAVQALGHIPVNVNNLHVDMLSASAHKFNGPKGVGFLYIRKGVKINSIIDGGVQEFGMRAGTENVAGVVGMAEALRKNCAQMSETENRLKKLKDCFINALDDADIDYIQNGSDNCVPGLVSISIKNVSSEMLMHRLDLMGICISTGSACDSVNTQVSHVIKEIALPTEYAKGTVRISFGKNNKEDDAREIANAIISILKK